MSSLYFSCMYKAPICHIVIDLVLFLETCLNTNTMFN